MPLWFEERVVESLEKQSRFSILFMGLNGTQRN